MTFEVRKVSNYGTKHPVVARLRLQTHELIQWADLTKEQEIAVVEIYSGMADRLLKCDEGYQRLLAAREESLADLTPSPEARVKTAPHVIGLKGEVETILYESKNFLRDLLGIFRVFFEADFEEANAFYNPKGGHGKLVEWANTRFGPDDPFTAMLVFEQSWTGETIQMRNAVEHPGRKSGTLYIENFRMLPDGQYLQPCWYRDKNAPSSLFPDLNVLLANLLSLAEDVLAECILHKTRHKNIQFYVIPENERRSDCPVRLGVTLKRWA